MTPYFTDSHGYVTLYLGDMRELLPHLPETASAMVTDPRTV
ncbi:hypothetical protein ACFQX6_67155 [Streptosporangium lutulentum]